MERSVRADETSSAIGRAPRATITSDRWSDLLAERHRLLDIVDLETEREPFLHERIGLCRSRMREIDERMVATPPADRRDVLAALGALIDGDYVEVDGREPDWRIIATIARAARGFL